MHIYVKSPSLSAYFHTKSPSLSDFFKKYLFICKKSSTFIAGNVKMLQQLNFFYFTFEHFYSI